MAENNKNGLGNVVKLAAGVVVGAAAGFAAGVLLAPKSGKETMEDVKDMSLKIKEDAGNYTTNLKDKGGELLKRGSETLKIGKKNVADDVVELKKEVTEATEKLPVEQVVAKVKKVGKDAQKVVTDVADDVAKEVKKQKKDADDDYSADSLLARIQGITADSLED